MNYLVGLFLVLLCFSSFAQDAGEFVPEEAFSGEVYQSSLGSPGNSRPAGLKHNILIIMADDMRTAVGSYDHPDAITPNLNLLASQGTQMDNMYAAAAACRPARTALFSGLRPETTGVTNNSGDDGKNLRASLKPNTRTLFQWLQENGYKTAGFCKILHGGAKSPPAGFGAAHESADYGTWDGVKSFDVLETKAGPRVHDSAADLPYLYSQMNLKEEEFGDYQCATYARNQILEWKNDAKPWFIAVGFWRPHVPWVVNNKYWYLYNYQALALPAQRTRPASVPTWAFNQASILGGAYSWPGRVGYTAGSNIGNDWTRKLSQAYYAATSFVDAQVGRVLNAVQHAGLANQTIVLFVSDQGFLLGELGDWGKISNFEHAVKVPAIFRGPGVSVNARRTVVGEHVDLYPTLLALAGVPLPTTAQHKSGTGLQGDSLVPVLNGTETVSKRAAFSQIGSQVSMRTRQYRLIKSGTDYVLFDMIADPNETTNIWSSASAGLKADLTSAFNAGGQTDLPVSLR